MHIDRVHADRYLALPGFALSFLFLLAIVAFAFTVERADEIGGCPDGSTEDPELKGITDALEAYEALAGCQTAAKG